MEKNAMYLVIVAVFWFRCVLLFRIILALSAWDAFDFKQLLQPKNSYWLVQKYLWEGIKSF